MYPFDLTFCSKISVSDSHAHIGATRTLTSIGETLKDWTSEMPVCDVLSLPPEPSLKVKRIQEYKTRTLNAVLSQLRWFAGTQIRNAATLAGNIVTASPISDLNPVWMATVLTCSHCIPRTHSPSTCWYRIPCLMCRAFGVLARCQLVNFSYRIVR